MPRRTEKELTLIWTRCWSRWAGIVCLVDSFDWADLAQPSSPPALRPTSAPLMHLQAVACGWSPPSRRAAFGVRSHAYCVFCRLACRNGRARRATPARSSGHAAGFGQPTGPVLVAPGSALGATFRAHLGRPISGRSEVRAARTRLGGSCRRAARDAPHRPRRQPVLPAGALGTTRREASWRPAALAPELTQLIEIAFQSAQHCQTAFDPQAVDRCPQAALQLDLRTCVRAHAIDRCTALLRERSSVQARVVSGTAQGVIKQGRETTRGLWSWN